MNNVVIIIAIVLIALFIIIAIIIFVVIQQRRFIRIDKERKDLEKAQEYRLAEAMVKSQEIERKSIAENLHEDIAPLLYLCLMDLNALSELKDFKYSSQLNFTKNNLNIAINKIRGVSHILHPAAIEKFGFFHGLKDFSSILNSSEGVKLEFDNKLNKISLDSFKQLMLFRIVQELAMNAIIHGKAKKMDLALKEDDQQLQLRVFHNGNRFMNEDYQKKLQQNESLGLKNIQHRIGLLQGMISYESVENGNLQKILITIPTHLTLIKS